MLHQPSGGANGMAADIAIVAEEIIKTRTRLNELYAHHTKQVGGLPSHLRVGLTLVVDFRSDPGGRFHGVMKNPSVAKMSGGGSLGL